MYGYSTVLIVMILTAISLLALACKTTNLPTSAPRPTPTAVTSKWLYNGLLAEKDGNPTRLKNRVERKEIWRFTIIISKIEGKRIQEHFDELMAATDPYIECEFKSERQIISLNVGQSVDVYGTLYEAFKAKQFWPDGKAVKFRNCYY